VDGGENVSTNRDFYGAGREDDSRREPFVFTNGEPPVLLGANEGANPVEFLLHALAGCVTTTEDLLNFARDHSPVCNTVCPNLLNSLAQAVESERGLARNLPRQSGV